MTGGSEKQYWMHRITGGENGWVLSYPLLRDHNILSIGWSFLSSQEYAKRIQSNGLVALKDIYAEEEVDWSKNAYSLLHFVYGMHKGDIVLVPDGKYVSIYQVADNNIITNETLPQNLLDEANVIRNGKDLTTPNEQYIDLGFYRRVEPVVPHLLRENLCEAIYKKTRVPQTNLNIKDVEQDIKQIILKNAEHPSDSIPRPIDYIELIDGIKHHLESAKEQQSFGERVESVFTSMHRLIRQGVQFEYSQKTNQKKTTVDMPYRQIENDIKKNVDVVQSVISAYMRGDIFTSIKLLDQWWDENKEQGFPYAYVHTGLKYYRTRMKEDKPFKELDLFHVPFDKRGSVTTKRYSIPGYPCLYLGKSIYVCWEEMKRPALSDFATSAFKAQEEIELLDLRLRKRMHSEEDCLAFLKMLPIILACSLSVTNEKDNFKPEYILPQLLLHIIVVRNQNKQESEAKENKATRIGGIEYTSTVANDDFEFVNKTSSSTYNLTDCIVLPVRITDKTKTRYCTVLARQFHITKPKYYENEYIKDSLAMIKYYMDSDDKHRYFNTKYDNSCFSYIEKSWTEQDFYKLTPEILK